MPNMATHFNEILNMIASRYFLDYGGIPFSVELLFSSSK